MTAWRIAEQDLVYKARRNDTVLQTALQNGSRAAEGTAQQNLICKALQMLPMMEFVM